MVAAFQQLQWLSFGEEMRQRCARRVDRSTGSDPFGPAGYIDLPQRDMCSRLHLASIP